MTHLITMNRTPIFTKSKGLVEIHLWCSPCNLTHEFDLEQVEMLVYAQAARLQEQFDGLVNWIEGDEQACLYANLEKMTTETQAVVLRNVQRREEE